MKEVNSRIIKCRKQANLNQTEMAEKLGIKCSTYSQMERSGIVSAERLYEIAKILGVTPCYLYSGYEPCKAEIKLKSENDIVLKQPKTVLPEKEILMLTRKEENLIKIIRNLSKDNRNKTIEFIDKIYKEDKK